MICEHCGSKVVDGGQVCAVCGMSSASLEPRPRELAKVITLRTKRREKERVQHPKAVRRRFAPALWWIIAIVVIALIVPYVLPLH